jgi:formylglycine-generating enzyme required for sulfatase activity
MVGLFHARGADRVAAAAVQVDVSPLGQRPSDDAPKAALAACPDDMVLVDGEYCPHPKQVCKQWMDPPESHYAFYRCAEYEAPATCESPTREHLRFCIDREEYVRSGDALPLVNQSWTSASRVCEVQGRRLCLESECNFACEGEEMRPYPYGFVRDAAACNIDQPHLGKPQSGLADLRAPVTAYPACESPFGVHDMSGNVEEWATLDHGKRPERSVMKGAWWLPGRNTCRAATLGHGETYGGPQVGVRCCAPAR